MIVKNDDAKKRVFSMELYQLRTFVTVSQTGHLTRAAEYLATSQSAVSAQIKALEEEFETALFIRTAKGMLLTAAGNELLEQAEKVLAESELLLQRARNLQNELIGTVRIGLSEGGFFWQIEQLCNLAASRHRRIKFHFLNSSSSFILQDITEDRLDCGFIFGDFPENKISGFFLRPQKIMVTAPKAWEKQVIGATWEEILLLPWAWQVPNCAYRKKAMEFFKSKNLEAPESILSADQDATILTLVASGACVGLVKEPDAVEAAKQGKVVIWEGDFLEVDLFFVFKREREQDPLLQAIGEIVRNVWDPNSDRPIQPQKNLQN
jgi:DNA-binding transcriptional LysR family regulator